MISPIQNTVSFTGMQDFMQKTSNKTPENVNVQNVTVAESKNEDVINIESKEVKKKPTFKQRVLGILKGYNNITRTSGGVVKGITDGAILAGAVGFIGRNIHKSKEANYNVGKIIGGMFSDAGKIIAHITTKTIPHIFTKAPIENLKNFGAPIATFYNKCMKGNKATSALAVTLFAGAVAFRTIQGKMIANKRNAEIDHHTGEKH